MVLKSQCIYCIWQMHSKTGKARTWKNRLVQAYSSEEEELEDDCESRSDNESSESESEEELGLSSTNAKMEAHTRRYLHKSLATNTGIGGEHRKQQHARVNKGWEHAIRKTEVERTASSRSLPVTTHRVENANGKAQVSQQDSDDSMEEEDSKETNSPSGACRHSPGSAENEKRGWIYKLVNTKTNKAYVGQTVKDDLAKRMSGHKNAWRRKQPGCRLLNASIKKHGWSVFKLEVLERPLKSNLDAREEFMIKIHQTLEPNGYNVLSGSNEVPMKNPFVRARRAKTMEKPEPRKRLSDGVKQARKRCTPEEHASWVENVRKAQTTPEMLKQRSESQKRARSNKTPEELAEWNLRSAQGMKQRAAIENEAKLASMSDEEGKKWLRKLQATREWRMRQKQMRTAETTAMQEEHNRL